MLGHGVQGPEPQVFSNLLVRRSAPIPLHVVLNKPVNTLLSWSQRRHEIPFFLSFNQNGRPFTLALGWPETGQRALLRFKIKIGE
jgi:hypothetical protein